MSTPLSFCDISARYGQMPAPRQSIEEQTGWNPNMLFMDYLNKVRRHREEQEEHAAEDALLAVIDAMTAPKEDRLADPERVAVEALTRAGPSLQESERFQELREKLDGRAEITDLPELQALMFCLSGMSLLRQVDSVQDERAEDKRLEVTEQRAPSDQDDIEGR